ncbi:MAG: SH3 domain-containing protein [Alphaproteobacteria bacterium]|nr:SH3 domain-containing protein [Alphaproteobacteria bacterium]
MARAAQMGKRLVARAKDADDDVVTNEPRAFPIDLLPLLAPHKKHGKLSLRVERLPQQTRLSAGTRNNDGSWSLTRDDLEDLEYLVPDGVEGATSLSVRVVSLTAGSTLAVLDYPLDSDAPAPVVEGRSDVAGEDVQVERLRDELAKLKASLAERDKALAAMPRAEASLAAAEARWAAEMEMRLEDAAAKASAHVETARRAWEAEQSERLSKLEARAHEMAAEARERAMTEARETTSLSERAWKAEEAARLAAAEAQWREQLAKVTAEAEATARAVRDAQDALAKAQSAWKADEAARLAAAEAQWREATAKAVAEARAEVDAVRGDQGEAVRGLRDQLSAAQTSLAARDAALAAANDALAKAQSAWKTDEAARLAAAEAQWREATAKAVAEARAEVDAVRGDQGEAVRGLREQLSAVQTTLAARDAALAAANDALAKAQSAWKTDEAARLAAAEGQWREATAKAVAEARAEVDAVRGDQGEAVRGLREQVSALESTLAARGAALAEAQEATARAARDAQYALSKAESSWKADEAARLAAAEAQWRATSAKAVAEAHAQVDAVRGDQGEAEAALRGEVAALKAAVEERDAALKRMAAVEEQAREAMPAAVESDRDSELRRLREKAATLEAKLIKANKFAEDEQLRWQREAQEAISRATKEWVAKESSRRATTEAQVRKEIGQQLVQATSRYEAAEAALSQLRIRASTRDEGRMEVELAGARASLVAREAELTRVREQLEAMRSMTDAVEAPVAAATPGYPRYVRDASIAAAIGVVVVVAYPLVMGLMSAPPPAPVVQAVVAPAPAPPPVVVRTAVLALDARLRAGPSTNVSVIAPLERGTSVTILEERGEWIRVRAAGKPVREGWVKISQLKDITPSVAPVPAAGPQPANPPAP